MENRIAYPMPHSGGYVVDPPIEARGSKYVHVTVVRVDGPDGPETIAYSAMGEEPLCWVEGWVNDDEFLGTFGYRVKRKPTTASGMVREFHETFGHPVASTPRPLDKERARKRLKWIQSEVDELRDAIEADDFVEQVDALADIKYFVEGDAIERGVPLDDVFREVHASNMSKLGDDGEPIYYDDGKVAKGPRFFDPRIAEVLVGAGWGSDE